MDTKQLDLNPTLVGIPTSELNENASDIWHLITEHKADKAAVYHFNNGEIHVVILHSDEELFHFAFICKNNQLLDLVVEHANNSDIAGKLYCSNSSEYRKIQFEFR